MVGEPHPLGRQPIDIWRLEFLLSITRQVAVPRIVKQDVNDIWHEVSFTITLKGNYRPVFVKQNLVAESPPGDISFDVPASQICFDAQGEEVTVTLDSWTPSGIIDFTYTTPTLSGTSTTSNNQSLTYNLRFTCVDSKYTVTFT